MKNKLFIFLAMFSFLGLYSCGQASQNTDTTADNTADTTKTVDATTSPEPAEVAPENNNFSIKDIETVVTNITPTETEVIIKDINVCTVKDYDGIKKSISCFDGGTKGQECDIYYSEGKAMVGVVNIEYYNASPADLGAFDESKTNKNEMKLHFKDGDLNAIEKVLDMQDNPTTMAPTLKPYWNILVEAAK